MKQYRMLILIIVILVAAIILDIPNTPVNLGRPITTQLGLDLVGGVQALLEADLPANQAIDSQAMTTARQIVENRVNGLGVSEAVVQQAGNRRIVVEIPGVKDPEQAIATIKTTGLLEFVDMSSIDPNTAVSYQGQTIKTDFAQTGGSGTSSSSTPAGASTTAPATNAPTATALSSTAAATASVQASGTVTGTKTAPSAAQTTPAAPAASEKVWHTVMTGAAIKNVAATTNTAGQYQVSFELTSDGANTFASFTTANVGKILAIVLDKKVISAPRIDSAITQGKGVITGNFTLQTSNALAVQLRYGSLPIPLKVVQSNTVGPTLGQDSLRKSLLAGAIGLIAVILFMALYYRLPGILADLALIVYALIVYALFRAIPVTLTLPGVAGFVLSVGMAVDANILIFERLKEELRAGRPLRAAIELGWGRAWPSIRDSNFSTLITCAILYYFGSTFGASIVKGFSLTLAIGVLVSLFTAIIVTRTFLHTVLDNIKVAGHNRWFGV